MDIADAQLVANAKKDKEQFKALYKKYISKVYNYFWYRVGHDNDVAEDLAQETFVRAYLNLQKFKIQNASYFSYLLTIAHNILVNYYRKPKDLSLETFVEVPEEVWSEIEDKDNAQRLWYSIQKLNHNERDILYFKYRKGYQVKEIATILNKSENAIKLTLSRARKKLKEYTLLTDIASFADKKHRHKKAKYLS
ncbi:sigma-70 family RNA polymerase sigma factor [Candidatus Nomurabacteria bacterium]|nr:sigma-70 family RNA polymerase sigma factor [Candidatus Kaiserbacteria bacterium]MCB9814040.1 sigma-70 family RNA polymerase sigma factor [Candidatus Nomurabacteria bacterium]